MKVSLTQNQVKEFAEDGFLEIEAKPYRLYLELNSQKDRIRYFEAVNMAVDALEIVKCKNCKHCEIDDETGYAYCDAWQRGTQSDWHCSRGEAR